MIKRLETLVIAFIVTSMAFAAPVSPSQARKIAERAFLHHGLLNPSNIQLIANDENTGYAKGKSGVATSVHSDYYIFSNNENKGFVIVSGDDMLPAVIAYSANTAISSFDNISPALKHLLDNYSRYVNDIRSGKFEAPQKEADNETGVPVVDALCHTTWDQGDPFNMLCPVINGQNSVVGCVATAMSQIMKYWNWPKRGMGKYSYVLAGYGQVTSDFSTHEYDWDNMCDSYPIRPKRSEAQRQAVALLCSDCGIAAHMDYSPSGSGTFGTNAQNAFVKHFGYAASKLKFLWKLEYPDAEDWFSIFEEELNARRPILMTAVSPIGTNDSGHAFVIDGYDNQHFVHVNWGWAGEGDGYYDLGLMNVTGSAYKEDQCIIVGIEPDYDGTDGQMEEAQVPLVIKDSINHVKDRFDQIAIHSLSNESPYMSSWEIKISLCDRDGNEILELTSDKIDNMRSHTYYPEYTMSCTISPMAGIPAGDYGIRVFTRQKDFDDWILPIINGGPSKNWIPVYFDGKKAHFNEVSDGIEEITVSESHSDIIYNINGQIVNGSYKGIVIKNGKKVFIK